MDLGLDALVPSVIGGVVVAAWVRWRDVPAEVERHDQRAYELNEDLRRFVRDRDAEVARVTRPREFSEMLAGLIRRHLGTESRSAEARAEAVAEADQIVAAKHAALHQYRDQASRAIRELRLLGASEGWLHGLVRKRRRTPPPRLALPEDCLIRLRLWREPVDVANDIPGKPVADPSSASLEPDLAALEATGITWKAPLRGTMPPT